MSNDNPYSEAQFKTLEYRPGFPARFTSIEALPDGWHRERAWLNLFEAACGPPAAAA